jgi:hypothetical protein
MLTIRAHVWVCPVYVLDPALRDGKKLPKWQPRTRRGQYLGVSEQHSSTLGKILHLRTEHVSPQYHVAYDDLFSSVPNPEQGVIDDQFDADKWEQIVHAGSERYAEPEEDDRGNPIPLPPLHDDWLTEARNQQGQARNERLAPRTRPPPLLQREAQAPGNRGHLLQREAQHPLQTEA